MSRLVLVLMGVEGSGKTTVAELLSARLGWSFQEGDALHPKANIEKMRGGIPLTDADRAPWLEAIASWIDERIRAGGNGLITCSALKRRYRDMLDRRGRGVMFIFLDGAKELIAARLASRQGHFMPSALLDSQFEDLEPPGPDEPAIAFNVGPAPEVVAQEIIDTLQLGERFTG